jgi:hypothetical protein
MIAESLSQHDEKHVVTTTLSGIRVGRRRRFSIVIFNIVIIMYIKYLVFIKWNMYRYL